MCDIERIVTLAGIPDGYDDNGGTFVWGYRFKIPSTCLRRGSDLVGVVFLARKHRVYRWCVDASRMIPPNTQHTSGWPTIGRPMRLPSPADLDVMLEQVTQETYNQMISRCHNYNNTSPVSKWPADMLKELAEQLAEVALTDRFFRGGQG